MVHHRQNIWRLFTLLLPRLRLSVSGELPRIRGINLVVVMILSKFYIVGYGDIHGTNAAERVLVILLAILGVMLFGYMLSSVANIVNSLTTDDDRLRQRIAQIAVFCVKSNVLRHFIHWS